MTTFFIQMVVNEVIYTLETLSSELLIMLLVYKYNYLFYQKIVDWIICQNNRRRLQINPKAKGEKENKSYRMSTRDAISICGRNPKCKNKKWR